MSKLVLGNSGTAKVSIDLDVMRVSHALVQGASGAGKSYLLRVIAEQLPRHIQTVIIDPEGEYASLREKVPYILVGKDGDTPVRTDTAELLAERVLKLGASAICDLYSLEREEQQEWVRRFITRLMSLPRSLWHPMVVIIDEAHLFAPEKGEGHSVSTRAVEDLCSRGRKHGIGIILATQRIAKLSNNAASEMQNNFVGRTFLQADREKAAKAMGVPKRVAEQEKFYNDLKVLNPGDFWCLGVAVSTERIVFHVASATTTHPEPGSQGEQHRPAPPDEIRAVLAELGDLPQQAEDQENEVVALRDRLFDAESESRELSMRIQELEAQVQERDRPVVVLPNVNGIRKKLEAFDKANDFDARLDEVCAALRFHVTTLKQGIETELTTLETDSIGGYQSTQTMCVPRETVGFREQIFDVDHTRTPEHRAAVQPLNNGTYVASDKKLRSGAERILMVLLQWYPKQLTRSKVAALVAMKKTGGTFGTYLSDLRTAGMIAVNGDLLSATDAARKQYAGQITRSPRTTREVVALWESKLRGGALRILQELINHRGHPVSRADLGKKVGMEPSGGTFGTYLSDLRTADLLVDAGNGTVAANKEALFL
jgi:energy-coupling factor transporter ATP-binding protein EcfA2